MTERTCQSCGTAYDADSGARFCAKCGALLPAGETLEVDLTTTPEPTAPAPPEPPAPPISVELPPAAPQTPLAQTPCPNCGELLYPTERICWKCGQSIAPAAEASAAPPAPMPQQAWQPGPTGPMPPSPSQEAMSLGYWALGLGIAGLIFCPFCGPFAIWMGMRANRAGAGGIGVVGLVLGGLATLYLVVLIGIAGLAIIGGMASSTNHSALPMILPHVTQLVPWLR